MMHNIEYPERDWNLNRAAWFLRPVDQFGGFSNMSKSFPLSIFGIRVRSSEHLYQAMRYTEEPEIQREVIQAKTPMDSKKVSRSFDEFTRSDWFDIRIDVMTWTLRVKLFHHATCFGDLLKRTSKRPILEWSRHDSFWGAGPIDEDTNRGQNVLGRLLTELRDQFVADSTIAETVPAPDFPEPHLYGVEVPAFTFGQATPLITASNLTALGLPPSPAFGIVVQACHQRQLNGDFSDVEQGLRVARQIWDTHKLSSSQE